MCAAASAVLNHFGWSLSSHFKCYGVVRLLTIQRDVPGSQPAEPSVRSLRGCETMKVTEAPRSNHRTARGPRKPQAAL